MKETHGTTVYFTEGDYRVTDFHWAEGSYLSVQHFCTAGRSGSPIKGWVGQYYQHAQFKEPCYVCGRIPPNGIQGVFAMLQWDRV